MGAIPERFCCSGFAQDCVCEFVRFMKTVATAPPVGSFAQLIVTN